MNNWQEEYKRKYAALKEQGKSFFPYAVFKDTLVAFLILIALVFLAVYCGSPLESIADPTDSTYNPRPEWYFLFLFQTLKLFPGNLEALAAVVFPGLGVLLLVLIPFLDRGPERHPLKRPFFTGFAILVLAGIIYQTWEGYRSPLINPIVENNPLVLEGQRLYSKLNCSYCHKISGNGGSVGPELNKVVGNKDDEFIILHLRDPQKVVPGTAMPKLNLLDDEIRALTSYVKSLGSGGPYSEEALKLFSENCAACHKIGNEGEELGPDLSLIGTARDKNYIKHYIMDPNNLNPSATMPGFKDELTDIQIEDLSRYLASTGRE